MRRYKEYGVGKHIGGCLYVEKSYIGCLPPYVVEIVQQFNKDIPAFQYKVIKWDQKDGSVSLIQSSDFDTAPEPTVEASIKCYGKGNYSKIRRLSHVYHHKWMFVTDMYPGFDVKESIERSAEVVNMVEKSDKKIAQLGTKKAWEAFLVEYE